VRHTSYYNWIRINKTHKVYSEAGGCAHVQVTLLASKEAHRIPRPCDTKQPVCLTGWPRIKSAQREQGSSVGAGHWGSNDLKYTHQHQSPAPHNLHDRSIGTVLAQLSCTRSRAIAPGAFSWKIVCTCRRLHEVRRAKYAPWNVLWCVEHTHTWPGIFSTELHFFHGHAKRILLELYRSRPV
jgi:hypothetical protein